MFDTSPSPSPQDPSSFPLDPHSVTGLPFFITGWLCVALGVAYLVHRFAHKSSVPWYVLIVAFFGWTLPFSIVYCLPVDLASSKYRACLSSQSDPQTCAYPIIYLDAVTQRIIWQVIYWFLSVLTWLMIPLLQSYFDCGGFTPVQRFKKAIKYNIWYYAVIGLIGVIFLAYIAVQKKLMNFNSIRAFVMALTSAYGLFLVVLLMGYGLVDIPRSLWKKANFSRSLALIEMRAPKVHESMQQAHQYLNEVQSEIQTLDSTVPIQDPLRTYVDQLLIVCSLTSSSTTSSSYGNNSRSTWTSPNSRSGTNSGVVTLKSLQQFHRKLKLAKLDLARKQQSVFTYILLYGFFSYLALEIHLSHSLKWRVLLSKAQYYHTLLDPPHRTLSKPTYTFFLRKVYPSILKVFSGFAMIFSLLILWSEVAMNWNWSVFQFLAMTSSFGVLMWFSVATLAYMALCLYLPLLHIQVFQKYMLITKHTDVGSLLFFAAYLTRCAFPLSYNVIHLLQVDHPVFAEYMGNVNLVPLLGDSFHDWVPLGLCLTSLVTLGRWQSYLVQRWKLDPELLDEEEAQCDRMEGQQLLRQAMEGSDPMHPWEASSLSTSFRDSHVPYSTLNSTWSSTSKPMNVPTTFTGNGVNGGMASSSMDMFAPLGKKLAVQAPGIATLKSQVHSSTAMK